MSLGEALFKIFDKIPSGAIQTMLAIIIGSAIVITYNWADKQAGGVTTETQMVEFQQNLLSKVNSLGNDVRTLRGKVNVLNDEKLTLVGELESLRNLLLALDSSANTVPFAYWLKDRSSKIIHVNFKFEEQFLNCRGFDKSDIIDNDYYSIWPEEIANKFKANDRKVVKEKKTFIFNEEIVMCDGTTKRLLFVKWPRSIGNLVVGVAAMHIPNFDFTNEQKFPIVIE